MVMVLYQEPSFRPLARENTANATGTINAPRAYDGGPKSVR
jgi:hypothetical protein